MKLKYPYYAQNPALKLLTVKTIDGETEYRANCSRINNIYYVKDKHLEFVGNKWVLKQNLIYDYEKKQYVNNQRGLIEGVVQFKNGQPVLGKYSKNIYKNCYVHFRAFGKMPCISTDILDENFIENLGEGIFYDKSLLSASQIRDFGTKRLLVNNNGGVYNIIDNKDNFKKVCDIYEAYQPSIDRDIKYVSGYLKNNTFGIEIETINGTLPKHICNQNGIIICKDGSLRDGNKYPPEYVTVPLKGAKGLQTIRNATKEITKRSDIDRRCSLHVHVGGFTIDRLFMIALYKLCYKIQDEVFAMFPYYKIDEVKYANKGKSYAKKLNSLVSNYKNGDFNDYINSSYEDIYTFLAKGNKFNKYNNFNTENNPWGGHKWDILSRYYWVNFTNVVFGKHKTIEFRVHTPTTNSDKIINWVLMCNAIILYAQKNIRKCVSGEKISFRNDILNYYANSRNTYYSKFLSANLIAYYDQRVAMFDKDFKNGEYLGLGELINDSTFSFNTINIS